MTTSGNRPLYRKHNSFVDLRNKRDDAAALVLERVRRLRGRGDAAEGLSSERRAVLERVIDDILEPPSSSDRPVFVLSPGVIDEIMSFPDESTLPRYLVHRYRYEIFPQQRVTDAFPPYLQIEPSSICNFRCVFCFETDATFSSKSSGHMGYMPLDLFKSVVDQVVGEVEFLSLASRGEPLLCPDIVPMLEYTRGKFLSLKLNTNAAMLDEPKCHAILAGGVKTLVFSADAATEPLYSKLRVNGKLEKVVANIERFQKIRAVHYPDSSIITRVSGVKISEQQDIDAMERFWGGLADQVAFVAYNPWENTYQQPENDVAEPCSDLWRRMFVWWDGRVNPCDVDYKSVLAAGNVREAGVSALWQSDAYVQLRRAHLDGERRKHDPCKRCTVT